MLNASVSLGRLGIDVNFISELGKDDVGDLIVDFLESNNINTNYIDRFSNGRSPLALAFLDKNKNASYTFYKDYPAQRLQQQLPLISENDIMLFGSFFSISTEVRDQVKFFVENARENGAIIIYDPNIRRSHKDEIPNMIGMIHENFSMADIIRASNEDFEVVFDIANSIDAFKLTQQHGNASLVYTTGGDKVEVLSKNKQMDFTVPEIDLVSTIGAGDNFNAGMIYSIIQENIHRNDLDTLGPLQWKNLIVSGIKCSQEVCKSYNNYIPNNFEL